MGERGVAFDILLVASRGGVFAVYRLQYLAVVFPGRARSAYDNHFHSFQKETIENRKHKALTPFFAQKAGDKKRLRILY